jgi:hypothetical protein
LQLRPSSGNNAQDAAVAESLQGEDCLDDQPVLDAAEGRGVMVTFEATALLDLPRPFTDDEMTELIAAVVDLLDVRVVDPSVTTSRSDSGVAIHVTLTIDTDDPWAAMAIAAGALREAFDTAVPRVAGMSRDEVAGMSRELTLQWA